MKSSRRSTLLGAAVIALTAGLSLSGAAFAAGGTILQVVGDIEGGAESGQFDLERLDTLPQNSFTTTTIWTEGEAEFSGPTLKSILAEVGAEGKPVKAFALNEYNVELELGTIEADVPIIATRADGKPLSRRDKGPLWIVFPYDSSEKYKNEVIYMESVWHLYKLQVGAE